MLDKLGEELYFQQTTLNILNRRQDVLAANIANADTPGYQARDIPFTRELRRAIEQGQQRSNNLSLSLTSRQHIPAKGLPMSITVCFIVFPISPPRTAIRWIWIASG
ncbi:Flagellar basal body rod protein FlgB [Sodalis praecaptivus]